MKRGIRCNETRFDSRKERDRIRFEFLSDDGCTPSGCVVKIGDIDTVTGQQVTNLDFFTAYHQLADHQVRKNLDAERAELTDGEKALLVKERERYIEDFRARWGYAPSKDNILYHMESCTRERWNLSVSVLVNEEGEDHTSRHAELSVPAETDEDIPVEMQALREVAASLTGRKAEVYQAMIQRAAGGKERLRFSDISDKYDVAPKQIHRDQEIIMEMVRKRAEELKRHEV